jgi:drug/metabolite transporter (DMT)-like permease
MVFGYGAHLSSKKWLAIIIGFIGFIPLLISQAPQEELFGELFSISIPELLLLGAVFSAALGWVLIKDLLDKGYSTWQANGLCMSFSGVIAILTWFFSFRMGYSGNAITFCPNMQTVVGVAIRLLSLVFLSNVFCYNLYGFLLHKYSATFISLSMMLVPLFGAIFGWYFLQETISLYFLVTLIITSAALYLFYQEDLNSKNIS